MSLPTRRPGSTVRVRVREVDGATVRGRADVVATEEPLEIRVGWPGAAPRSLVVTMRTPGADFELAAGFLRSEGLLTDPDDVVRLAYCTDPTLRSEQRYNVVTADLARPLPDAPTARYGAATSACGVCGKESLDELELRGCSSVAPGPELDSALLCALPDRLREAQNVFSRTGGLHAAGLFTADGTLVRAREDIGRHNAVDKVVGWAFLERRLPLAGHILVTSGRAGYEICQKALAAGIPFVAAVGAPSSLAVDLAERFGMTLVGFLRGERYVAYTHPERLAELR
ncbi:formate dehydrogenase accessory sulfurtransferase FdhD [Actinopolymorpha singaporensis]|uniref:Sulfur carrier protein FdhD n=1 Tax=Actinopolymorpha singaporensis TaxID=117157 RepID=A0A1H1WXF9_9ACTN|nr:formate dehydrogenase accessory sulfurtransferase FdhD [Actinopolymorpha singaporensis]SDT00909.1 FdhD protein [Actinopolymorpha singaporensis]